MVSCLGDAEVCYKGVGEFGLRTYSGVRDLRAF